LFNPYPGLRAFEAEEDHLFFGREREVDELLRRLRSTRFLAVVGTSGSGKSSLVRCGLISALYGGYMVQAGSTWRVAKFRPSEDPIGNLAAALSAPEVLGTEGELASANRFLLESTLRRGPLGLIDAVRLAKLPPYENLLVLVDQFEELFRFRRSHHILNPKDEATTFIKLLLEATHREDVPIYIVLTMRSDFIGECMEYTGLPEAVTAGQYLIPRLSRDELRAAITGPAAVGGARIAPRLVVRLLNELGDDQDQLPVLQHALMRAWAYWERVEQSDEPIDIAHYEAIGTLRSALSLHVEEAYQEAGSDHNRLTAERVFKALTDTFSDPRGLRRPTSVQDLAAICNVPEAEVIQIVETFRNPERCFLTPPANVVLESRSTIDLSHESLMRCWTRLIAWAEEERVSAEAYVRLSQASARFEAGTAGLWRDPELELGLQWQRRNQPTPAWAERYDPSFTRAIQFLDRSAKERDRLSAEAERARKRKLREYQWAASIMATLLLGVGILAYVARDERARAEKNLRLAQTAVDEMLSSAGREQARVAADVPQMEEFRRELLSKARSFYSIFITQKPDSETLRNETTRAHFRLGDIDRLLQEPRDAADEYKEAISQYEALVRDYPRKTEYRQALANSYNWLGETLRINMETSPAGTAYESALRLQRELVRGDPENKQYQRELARTYYNRGILSYSLGHMEGSDSDFREAIRLLTPLTEKEPDSAAAQELARVYNDLGNLLLHEDKFSEAKGFYQLAIQMHEALVKKEPANREYKQELATFNNNFAILLLDQRQFSLAEPKNRQALDLIEGLATPALSLRMELANAHNVRCQLLESMNSREAGSECHESLDLLNKLAKVPALRGRPEVKMLFRDLGYNFVELARINLVSGSVTEAQSSLENLGRLLPEISEPDRRNLTKSYQELQEGLRRQVHK
jgi:tetratricopeptide (TPR) repeat protein